MTENYLHTYGTHERYVLDNLTGDNKNRFMDYRNQWKSDGRSNIPLSVDFELRDACNLRCRFCVRNVSQKNRGELGFNTFCDIIDECASIGVPAISVGTNSEALLEPLLCSMLQYAKASDILDIWLYTNATLLTEHLCREISKYATVVSISLDANTPETYVAIRGKDYFNSIVDSINCLMSYRRNGLPVVRLTFIDSKVNRHEKRAFLDRWIDRCIVSVQEFVDLERDTVKTPKSCHYLSHTLSIAADGRVNPCCSFYGYSLDLGNVRGTSIMDVWNGSHKAMYDNFRNGNYTKECLLCGGD